MNIMHHYGIRRVCILGAGFSAPLGMPLTDDLLSLVHAVASTKPWYGDGGKAISHGQAAWLLEQLKWYFPLDKFTHSSIRRGKLPAEFDIEKFLSYVAATSAFQFKTGQRWDNHGDKFSAFMKTWLAEAILDHQTRLMPAAPSCYKRFATNLQGTAILTFNWDTIVETLLDNAGRRYKFDLPSTFEDREIPIIKLHGSIDWFSRPSKTLRKNWMHFKSVNSNFRECVRAEGDLQRYYNTGFNAPWIIMPSYDKISQVVRLGDVWQLPWLFLQDKLEVLVIGYSMRPDDFHSRAFLHPQLVDGSRRGDLTVKVIDYALTATQKDAIRARYAGIKNCQFYFGGFSDGALDFANFPA
jgi:hypothetical protein